MKRLVIGYLTALTLGLGACANAQTPPPPAGGSASGTPLDLTGFVAEVDKDGDGCMSQTEWFGLGLPKSANDILKDASGCVTLKKMQDTAPPPGLDLNGDGKLTVAEFIAFDKKGPPGGGAPPPPK